MGSQPARPGPGRLLAVQQGRQLEGEASSGKGIRVRMTWTLGASTRDLPCLRRGWPGGREAPPPRADPTHSSPGPDPAGTVQGG